MNKHLLLTIIVLCAIVSAKSQTNVSGNITGNTTWTKAGSPYILTGNVGVRTDYTLTIEPEVVVKRTGNFQILINGAVQIKGTPEDSVQFVTNINPVPNQNGFPFPTDTKYFIEFQKSDLNNSSLSYINFRQSNFKTNNIRLGNESESSQTNPKNSGTLTITHSNLSNGYTTTNGYQTGAHLAIDSCIMNNGFVYGYSARTEDINISNSQITNSVVWSNSIASGISFANCYLANNQLYLMSHTEILNSTLENNKGESFGGEDTTLIENSNFINTYFNYPYTNFDISDSKFTINDQLTDPYGNNVQLLFNLNQISAKNVQFTNNSSYTISGINIIGSFNPSAQNDTIIHNQFSNFYDVITVNNFAKIRLDSNSFSIPGRYDINNQSPKDFSALYNYYQLKNGQTIDDVIFDQNDDLSYGLVTYIPYITDPVVLPVTSLHFSGTAAGQVVKLNWQAGEETNLSEYVVERKEGNSFVSIGFIAAGGSNYNFTDALPVSGANYYRLKIVDVDGRYSYSDIVPVSFTVKEKRLLLYPNPASIYAIVEHKAVNTPAQIILVDMQGRKLKTVVVAVGSTQTKIDLPAIAKGIYKIVWQQDGKTTESQTLLIQ